MIASTDAAETRKERAAAFNGAIRDDCKATRVPLYTTDMTWRIYDAGYTFQQALFDWDIMFDVLTQYHKRYDYDLYFSTGIRNPLKMSSAIGCEIYKVTGDYELNYPDSVRMSSEEYPELIEKGLKKFYFENVIPRIGKFTDTEDAIEKLAHMAEEEAEEIAYVMRWRKQFYEGYGVVLNSPLGQIEAAPDFLFSYMRGMKEFAIDLRRRPQQVKQACDVIFRDNGGFSCFEGYGEKYDWGTAYTFASIAHSMLNDKQFGELVWPTMKTFAQKVAETDTTAYLFFEGGINHIIDYFGELPSGHFMLWQEMDDIHMLKKKLPKLTHVGGMTLDKLGKGTEKECVDFAKELIDSIGFDGKYVFTTNKFPSYPKDCTRSNLTATLNFIRDYGVYR